MSDLAGMSNIAYKKGSWMRYALWGAAALCIVTLVIAFCNAMSGNISATVPEGYRFSVTDNSNDGKIHTTYYIYDDHIIVEDESNVDNITNRAMLVYDNVITTSLSYDPEDTIEICELGVCQEKPKVLAVIKNILSRKTGREYIGF